MAPKNNIVRGLWKGHLMEVKIPNDQVTWCKSYPKVTQCEDTHNGIQTVHIIVYLLTWIACIKTEMIYRLKSHLQYSPDPAGVGGSALGEGDGPLAI